MNVSDLPRYECNKIVRAAKITSIKLTGDHGNAWRVMIFGEIGEEQPFTGDWKDKHNPEVGGYFVVYEDGYESFSPPIPFENGYKRMKME